jgi:hypothetical protein
MSEIAALGIACAVGIPLTALIVGLVCRSIMVKALETQVVGGTPIELFREKLAVEIEEKRQRIEARKPKKIPGVMR